MIETDDRWIEQMATQCVIHTQNTKILYFFIVCAKAGNKIETCT